MIICLSPRSAYFYEFPPNERTGKKKTTFSRFLKTLKSSKHKDKHTTTSNSNHHNSPKHSNVNSRPSPSQGRTLYFSASLKPEARREVKDSRNFPFK
ncbi:hypothetical protein M8J76_016516 [Diaphorina citri]|nr:hypothetical protein M8J76_016516 [Diaphorina citri]